MMRYPYGSHDPYGYCLVNEYCAKVPVSTTHSITQVVTESTILSPAIITATTGTTEDGKRSKY